MSPSTVAGSLDATASYSIRGNVRSTVAMQADANNWQANRTIFHACQSCLVMPKCRSNSGPIETSKQTCLIQYSWIGFNASMIPDTVLHQSMYKCNAAYVRPTYSTCALTSRNTSIAALCVTLPGVPMVITCVVGQDHQAVEPC